MASRARILIVAFSLAITASAQTLGVDVAIEGGDRSALHRALDARRARLVFWGASHTASDQYTGALRDEWQERFGDRGPGWVLPVRAFSLYEHREAVVAPVGAWTIVRGRTNGAYGPHGIAIDANVPAVAWIELASGVAPVDEAIVYFLRQPNGGTFEVRASNGARQRVRTIGSSADVIAIRGPLRRIEIIAIGDGPVRLFGVSLERRSRGVIVDSLGIPGARMRDRLSWNDAPLRAHVSRLDPSMIALAYGTNETSGHGSIARDARAAEEAIRRARSIAPRASCIVIGPSDWPLHNADGTWSARPRTIEITSMMREVAHRHGCGFFDFVRFMGGPASMPRWVGAGLALDDHVHFTDDGYRLFARALSRALLRR